MIRPPSSEAAAHLAQQSVGVAQVLQDVCGDRDVVAGADLVGEPLLEVGLVELVDPGADAGELEVVHAGHVVTPVAQPLAEQATGATDVEHPQRLARPRPVPG